MPGYVRSSCNVDRQASFWVAVFFRKAFLIYSRRTICRICRGSASGSFSKLGTLVCLQWSTWFVFTFLRHCDSRWGASSFSATALQPSCTGEPDYFFSYIAKQCVASFPFWLFDSGIAMRTDNDRFFCLRSFRGSDSRSCKWSGLCSFNIAGSFFCDACPIVFALFPKMGRACFGRMFCHGGDFGSLQGLCRARMD